MRKIDNVYLFRVNSLMGLIDLNLKNIISFNLEECGSIQEGFFSFKKNNKYGWIDTSGKILIKGLDYCHDFEEGFGIFRKGIKYGWIDKNGKILKTDCEWCDNFRDGFAKFGLNKKIYWIDVIGNIYDINPYQSRENNFEIKK